MMQEMSYKDRFWKSNWDSNIKDLDPKEFETSFIQGTRRTFEEVPEKSIEKKPLEKKPLEKKAIEKKIIKKKKKKEKKSKEVKPKKEKIDLDDIAKVLGVK